MSKAAAVEPPESQGKSETISSKPARTPEEEAAHLLKKEEKQKKKAEKRAKHRWAWARLRSRSFSRGWAAPYSLCFTRVLASDLGVTIHGSSSPWRVTRSRSS